MRLVSELRRRNVPRMAVLYVVAAWLILQVAEVLIDLAKLPDSIGTTALWLLGIGFPIALIFSWFYEITPEGISLENDVDPEASITHVTGRRLDFIVISLLCAAVILFAYDKWWMQGPPRNSIAVLPFVNMSDDASNEYFSDGISEELLNLLANIPELRVIARTSSFAFKGKNEDLRVIGRTLGVKTVLEGSVRKSGDRVRITAQLIDVSDGAHIWSETFDRTMTDIFEIQDDVASAIVDALQIHVGGNLTRGRPTESTEAYDYYLRGRDYLRRPAEEPTLASAVELFDRAIGLDPRFAQAHAGLCDAQLGTYRFARRAESFESAEVACQHALNLDDSLWEVHVALGSLYQTSGQHDRAILELESAILLQPGSVDSYLVLATTYAAQSRWEQAEETIRRAESVDSGYWAIQRAFGHLFYDQGRYDEAIERYRKVIQLAPDSSIGYDNLGNTYLAMGALDQAEKAFSDARFPSRWTYTNRGLVYYYQGEFVSAIADQKRAIELGPDSHHAWGRLGDAYRFVQGEEMNARSAYERAIELAEQELSIDPTDWDSIGRLGLAYAYTEQPEQAVEQIQRMFELTTDATAYYFASRVYLHLGEIDRAYDYLHQVIEGGWPIRLIADDPDFSHQKDMRRFEEFLNEPK
jgi:TolB-like protein/tetratricopeptide (TPR) repeat protein